METLAELAELHCGPWQLEDRARSQRAGDAEIANMKRAIDEQDGQRNRLNYRFGAVAGTHPGASKPPATQRDPG